MQQRRQGDVTLTKTFFSKRSVSVFYFSCIANAYAAIT